jgi:hypothetical protein
MKGRNLVLLAILAIILVGLATLSSRSRRSGSADSTGKKVFNDLAVNDVTSIVIRSAGRETVLAKSDNQWVCASRHNYPAQFEKIKGALLKLADMKIGLVMKSDDTQRKAFKIVAPTVATSNVTEEAGTLVELLGSGNKAIASLLLGTFHMRKSKGDPSFGGGSYPDGRYLSPDKGQNVYLVTDTLDDLSDDPKNWLDTELLSVYSSDLSEITVTHSNAVPYRVSRNDATWTLNGVADNETTDESKATSLAGALGYLRFDDIASPTLTDEQAGMVHPVVYSAAATNGEIYTVRIGAETPEGRYTRIAVSLSPAPEAGTAGTNEVAAAEARKAQEQSVKALNARISRWTYILSSHKTESMIYTRDVLVKKKELPAEPASSNITESATGPASIPVPAP